MGARYFGQAVPRVEDPRLLTGKGRYVDDINLPGMLHAAFVRSSYAHANILGIDRLAATALPGVRGIFTLADFGESYAQKRMPLTFPSPLFKRSVTQYPLAKDEVCYVGEAIAIVVAESRHVAEDAAALVAVDYEPLPAISDCRDAVKAGATLAHADAPDNRAAAYKTAYGDIAGAFQN